MVLFKLKKKQVFLLFEIYQSILFNEQFFGYEVQPQKIKLLKNINELPNVQPCIMIKIKEILLITPRYKL